MQRLHGKLAGVMLAACCVPAVGLGAAPNAACVQRASAALAAFTHGRFDAMPAYFAPAVAQAASPAALQSAWTQLATAFGTFDQAGAFAPRTVMGQAVLIAPLTFARGKQALLVACDATGKLTGFRILPGQAASAPAPVKAHGEADGVRVEPLGVPSKFGPLRGALTLPAGTGPFSAVVLVGGSGPDDLDEAVGGAKPFRDIADGLAKRGIATLRYDKRQVDYPLQMSANAHLTVDDEETDDALSAAHLLAKQKLIDPQRVFVLGHSEGGMLAPRIGQRDPAVAGLILAAAPARSILTVLREQTREQGARQGLPKARIAASEKALAAEQALLAKADPQHPPAGAFGGAPQTWWLSLHDYDQIAVAKALKVPMLFLQGGSDFQVSPTKDFDAWKAALAGRPNVTFRLFLGLSHLFTPAGKTLTTADYATPAHVDPAVIETIAKWVKAQPAAK